MRIDLLLDSQAFGGIEAHVLQLAKALRSNDHEVTVLLMVDYGEHPLKENLDSLAIAYEHLRGASLATIKRIKQRAPDVIHTHGYKAGIIGRIAALHEKMACCSSFHAGESPVGRLRFYTWLDRATAGLADNIIAVSDAIASELPERTRVVNNFVEFALNNPNSTLSSQETSSTFNIELHNSRRVAFVGRLSQEKGADRFIDAARILPHVQFDVFGEGPLLEEFQKTAPSNITFHGRCNMESLWSEIGVIVMPSRAEGLPLAALEAMSRGVQIIATPVGALPTLIDHEKNGWLIDGTPSSIASRILEWMNQSHHARAQMRYSAKMRIATRYSDKVILPKFLECYRDATSRYAS